MNKEKPTILITAGPTVEPIDPIRYLSNYSTGIMGYEVAKEARKRGFRVILISGPTSLRPPRGITFVSVKTARDMKRAVSRYFQKADSVVMAAAVSDFRPSVFRKGKIKKEGRKTLSLRLKRNPDILAGLGRRKGKRVLVGYSLQTDRTLCRAAEKLRKKRLDIIVVNTCGNGAFPFGESTTDVTILDKNGASIPLKGVRKSVVARVLLDKITNTPP